MTPIHTKPQRSSLNKGTWNQKEDRDQIASTVRLVNVSVVQNQSDLLHLVANTIKKFSRTKTNLVGIQASSNTMTYQVVGKQLAVKIGRAVAAAFKHYHPVVEVVQTKKPGACQVTVTFA